MTALAPSRSSSSSQKPQKPRPFRLPFRTLRPQPPRRDFGGRPPPDAWDDGGEDPEPEPLQVYVPTYIAGVPALGFAGFRLVQPRP